jgi:hypothetical protein
MKAVCHATAYILARDAEFNIALRQVLQTVSVTVCVKILQKRFQISFSTPVVSFHIAVNSPNPVILGGFLQEAKVTACEIGLFDCDIKLIGPHW